MTGPAPAPHSINGFLISDDWPPGARGIPPGGTPTGFENPATRRAGPNAIARSTASHTQILRAAPSITAAVASLLGLHFGHVKPAAKAVPPTAQNPTNMAAIKTQLIESFFKKASPKKTGGPRMKPRPT